MRTYGERTGRKADFEVHYRFLAASEGGRTAPPHQHVRWDFMYAEDDPTVDGVNMVWPEFISVNGEVLPEGEVPAAGWAQMFIVDRTRVPFHGERINVGVRGFLMEGSRKVAELEVTRLLGLTENEV